MQRAHITFKSSYMLFQAAEGRRREREHLVGDGAGVLHGHHQVTGQEVDQDVGDVRAQGLQDVLGNVDLGFICTSKGFPLS